MSTPLSLTILIYQYFLFSFFFFFLFFILLLFFFLFLLLFFFYFFFFFNDTPTTEIYTLSLHDALPIYGIFSPLIYRKAGSKDILNVDASKFLPKTSLYEKININSYVFQYPLFNNGPRSEEHTSELQSRPHLVCRLLLEKKKKKKKKYII